MLAMMLLQFFNAFRPKRLVLTFHGSEMPPLRRNRSPAGWGAAHPRATRISTLSTYTQDLLCKHFPEARPRLPHARALRARFRGGASRAAAPREKNRHPHRRRLHPRKASSSRCRAAGARPSSAEIEYGCRQARASRTMSAPLREAPRPPIFPVKFFGDVPDDELEEISRGADIFAMTSINHGDSIEASARLSRGRRARPAGHRPHGGRVSEAVDDGATGLWCPRTAPRSSPAAFEKLITDPACGPARRQRPAWARRNCCQPRALFSHDRRIRARGLSPSSRPCCNRARRSRSATPETDAMGIGVPRSTCPGLRSAAHPAEGNRLPYRRSRRTLPPAGARGHGKYVRPPSRRPAHDRQPKTMREKNAAAHRLSTSAARRGMLATGHSLHAFVDLQGKPVRPAALCWKHGEVFPG